MRIGLVILAALALTSCSKAGDYGPQAASASKRELGQMNRDFAAALNAKDAARAASYYSEEAVLIPPGEPLVRGRAAIEEYLPAAVSCFMWSSEASYGRS